MALPARGIGAQATTGPTVAVASDASGESAVSHGFAADVSVEVAAAIAGRWGMDASSVVVELISVSVWPAAGTPFRLTGSGRDGRWAVWFDEHDGTRQLLVRAGVITRAITAARDLERDTELTAADLSLATAVAWGAPGSAGAPVEPGWVARRRIAKGEELRRPAVEPPHVVKAGDDVRIEAVRGSITLTLSGRSSGSGAVGETVQVRAQTGRRLEAVVVGPGLVRIGTVREER